jgi:predicted  nucleic acid-binding Zn-ribbon protein
MEKGESSSRGYGMKIVIGIMLCILIVLGGMLFSINSKLDHLQASMEKRISALEKKQDSLEQSLVFLKDIQPEIESLQRRWEALKEKMTVIQQAVEKFIDEILESFSSEQKEKVKKAFDKFFRLWEAFGEFIEEIETEIGETQRERQGEGGKE